MLLGRRVAVQALNDCLCDKSKILSSQKVTKVASTEKNVHVRALQGLTFVSGIDVSTDGIHSQVCKEMWRIADEVQPGHITHECRRNTPVGNMPGSTRKA